MRYIALACDYDGTLANGGHVNEATLAALERLRASGRRLILVTGRELDDLLGVFPRVDLFERVVVENGGLLYRPSSREEKVLGERPSEQFLQALRDRHVAPLSIGRVIVATRQPNETKILELIRDLGLELQVIFNKGAVMILPSGVNKASGLGVALKELGLSLHNTVGIGDAENDHAFLSVCECCVAVANALSTVRERADFVTQDDDGGGVIELVEELLSSDLGGREPLLHRHHILLGASPGGQELYVKPYGENVLLAGASGSGKSTLATGVLERLSESGYQFCIIDPEGDYQEFEDAVVLGDNQREPSADEVIHLLEIPGQNAVVNLLGIALEHRPEFFQNLLPRLQQLRVRTGRPHWIVIDEAHHLLPSSWDPAAATLPQQWHGTMLITVHPEHVAPTALSYIDSVIAIGEHPERIFGGFCGALGQPAPDLGGLTLDKGDGLYWRRGAEGPPAVFRIAPPRAERRRHHRKYAQGYLGPDKSFYFRGPEGKLNLRAQNLTVFMQLAEGVDDATWLHHLRQGDYSRWFREAIKDGELAVQAARIEAMEGAPAEETRARIRAEIEQRYSGAA